MSGKISHDRACEMINALFAEKLKEKEDEVELISQRIKDVQSALQLVRYGAVTNLSNQTQIYVSKQWTRLSYFLPCFQNFDINHWHHDELFLPVYLLDTRHSIFTPKYF